MKPQGKITQFDKKEEEQLLIKPKTLEEKPALLQPKKSLTQDEPIKNSWETSPLKKEPELTQKPKLQLPLLSRIIPLSSENNVPKEQPTEIKITSPIFKEKPISNITPLDIKPTITEPVIKERPRIQPIPLIPKEEKLAIKPTITEPVVKERPLIQPIPLIPKEEKLAVIKPIIKENKPEEAPLDSARSDNSMNQSGQYNKLRVISLQKKSYVNIPSIVIPQSRLLDKQQDTEAPISTRRNDKSNIDLTLTPKNSKVAQVEPKKGGMGLFSYSKK